MVASCRLTLRRTILALRSSSFVDNIDSIFLLERGVTNRPACSIYGGAHDQPDRFALAF